MCFFSFNTVRIHFLPKKQSIAKQQVYALTANDVSPLNSSLCFDREEMPPMTLVLVWVINKTFTFSCVVAISTGGLNNAFQYLVAWLKARLIEFVGHGDTKLEQHPWKLSQYFPPLFLFILCHYHLWRYDSFQICWFSSLYLLTLLTL